MSNNVTSVWKRTDTQQMVEALLNIGAADDMKSFLRDVMTEKEIIEISSRLEAARMLKAGFKYTDIIKKTKLSSRTVARISDWMQNGCNGYAVVIDQINHHSHMMPARAV